MIKELTTPHEFQKIIKGLLGDESPLFFDSLNQTSPPSIRINPSKNYSRINTTDIPWAQWGKYLKDRPIYTLDPLLHAGAYYVQEPSSMFLEHAIKHSIDLKRQIVALDLCAAPGGKSTHLLSLLNLDSLLVSNEVIRSRASILSENIQKWGYPNAIVTNNDPAHFTKLSGAFDLIVVDAPCSGEGLFRKDHEALNEWSLSNVELCTLRQRRILKDVWPALKQNGILIYCTCTYNTREDEETIEWLNQVGDVEFITIPIQPEWGIVESKSKNAIGYRFYPHKVKGEGFFISVLRKKEPQNEVHIYANNSTSKISKEEKPIKSWLKNSENFSFVSSNKIIGATPLVNLDLVNFLVERLNTLLIGTPLAINKHGKLVPEHGSALSVYLNREHFVNIDFNLEQALQFLRKAPLEIQTVEKGFALATYNGIPLGWMNLLSNRINNMYPSNWRIRMKTQRI